MTPTLVLYNAKIYTQWEELPWASAIAVTGNRITAVGDDTTIRALAADDTTQRDMQGFLILPGLNDSHFHFYNWAIELQDVKLGGCKSLEEMQSRIRQQVANTPDGQWVKGVGWVETEWNPPIMPTAADLDAVSTTHPMAFWRTDMHGCVVNHKALELAGITRDIPNPPGGVIDRDADGNPTGRLFELAIGLIRSHIPDPTDEERDRFILIAQHKAHHLGLTGIHDQRMKGHGEGQHALRSYGRLDHQGLLKLRLTTNVDSMERDHAFRMGLFSGLGNDRLQLGHMKIFVDGSLGSQTAWMLAPFEGSTDNYGVVVTPVEEIHDIVREGQKHGWAISVHAIGDRANREILDVFEELIGERLPTTPFPHRIEHVQTVDPEDLPRLSKLGIVASVQPIHATDDWIQANRLWGQRGANAYNFRSLLDLGTTLALGSDCPVADPNPLAGIHAAVTRQRADGTPEGGWYPAECISVEEAVHGYTVAAHEVVGRGHYLGRLAPGYLADMTILDNNIFDVPPQDILSTTVEAVVFDGEYIMPHI